MRIVLIFLVEFCHVGSSERSPFIEEADEIVGGDCQKFFLFIEEE